MKEVRPNKNSTDFLVPMAVWPHSDSIPNSEVKRISGEDTLGVAPRENSSVPGFYSAKAVFSSMQERAVLAFKYKHLGLVTC